jgi:hypothetical protein
MFCDTTASFTKKEKTLLGGWVLGDRYRAAACRIRYGHIARAEMPDAEDWHARQPQFWVVVVAPWVLVQEVRP